jgi:hypothetical protein
MAWIIPGSGEDHRTKAIFQQKIFLKFVAQNFTKNNTQTM